MEEEQAVQRPEWLQKIIDEVGGGGYTMTPDDIMALANWMTLQEMQNQYGQIDLQGRQMDLTGRQLDQQMAEQDFVQSQYFPWYSGPYFDFQQRQAENEMAMSNNQVAMSDDDRRKSANYLEAQRLGVDQARYGTQAAKVGLWETLGFIPPSSAQRELARQKRMNEIRRGMQDREDTQTPPRRGGY